MNSVSLSCDAKKCISQNQMKQAINLTVSVLIALLIQKAETVMEPYWLQLGIVKLEVRRNETVLGEESLSNRIFLNILS